MLIAAFKDETFLGYWNVLGDDKDFVSRTAGSLGYNPEDLYLCRVAPLPHTVISSFQKIDGEWFIITYEKVKNEPLETEVLVPNEPYKLERYYLA